MANIERKSFNCTFMELKSLRTEFDDFALPGFNCTFMELKLGFTIFTAESVTALIVPLWN